MNFWTQRRRARGFTLIELIVVMVIIVLLAGGVTAGIVQYIERAKRARAESDLKVIADSLERYIADVGNYPATDEGLEALLSQPPGTDNWQGPYLKETSLEDPWGNPYQYDCPGQVNPEGYDLFSLGKDGQEGGEGKDADIWLQ